jgi:pimeloyl-ACP methyl ester carboxylesterase
MPLSGTPRRPTPPAFLVVPIVASLLFGSCAMFRKYDMAQIHQESAASATRNPVIVIHGFIGSKLRNIETNERVWGGMSDAIKRSSIDDLTLPIDRRPIADNRDDLIPYALYERIAGVKFYGAMMDALRDVGGYRVGDINNPTPADTCFVYLYDWRRDNVESSIGLGRTIRQIKARLGNPDLKFDIVAHSMGGYLATYYLKYGLEDVVRDGRDHPVTWAGAPDLGRVILVGTPLRGTMAALKLLNNGISRSMSPDEVFTMPSVYQLLPDDGRGRLLDPAGNRMDTDLYDADTWVRNGWSVFGERKGAARVPAAEAVAYQPGATAEERLHPKGPAGEAEQRRYQFLKAALQQARGFRSALDREAATDSPVPVHVFGSDCIPTLDRAILKPTAGGPVTLFDGEATPDRSARQMESELMAPGDGTVTARSLMGLPPASRDETGTGSGSGARFASTFFVCETHGLLPANPGFQDNLFYVLFHGQTKPAAVVRSQIGN